jgi:hypothetical protein
MAYIYSISMRLVWSEESAEFLLPLLESLSSPPIQISAKNNLFQGMLHHQKGLLYGKAELRYAKAWTEIENKISSIAPAQSAGSIPQPGADPYRNTKTDEHRLLDLFMAGEAPLYALGYFSVGASSPHNRGKLALLFQELCSVVLSSFWWRMSPNKEEAPLSTGEVVLLGLSKV